MALTRLFNFQPGAVIISSQFNDEYNQLVNTLNGINSNQNVIIRLNSGLPPLLVNNIGGGQLFSAQANGVEKVVILNSGQIQSSVPGGTSPFIIASNSLVANLNADLVDGIEGANLVRKDVGVGQILVGNLQISHPSDPALVLEDTDAPRSVALQLAGNTFRIFDITGSQFPLVIDLTTDVATFLQIPVLPASNPTTANQSSRKQYVDDQIATAVLLTGNQSVAGIKTFSSIPVLPAANPSSANEASRKQYVDDSIGTRIKGSRLVCDVTANQMTGASETDLTQYTIPANTLQANNDYIRFTVAAAATQGNSNLQEFRVRLNGTVVHTIQAINGFLGQAVDITVVRTSDTTCKVIAADQLVATITTSVNVNSLSGSTNVFKGTGQTNNTTGTVTQHLLAGESYIA